MIDLSGLGENGIVEVNEPPVDNKSIIDYDIPSDKKLIVTFTNGMKVELYPSGKIVYPEKVSYKVNSRSSFEDEYISKETEVSFIYKTKE